MSISRIAMVAVAVFFGSLFHSAPGYAQWLFTELPKTANVVDGDAAVDPTILRSRVVGIDWALANTALGGIQARGGGGNSLLLNFFQDVVLSAVLDRKEVRSPEKFTAHGHIDGARESEITLVALDGVMVGNIRVAGSLFQIRYIGNGVHAVREIDESRFPPDGEPVPISLPNHSPPSIPDQLAMDSAAGFDVMVLYTPAARAAAGGATAMTALVNLAVAETNTAYSRSGVIPRVRLVYSGEVAGYTEAGDFSTDLSRLRSPSDGFMDNIHALRNAFGADMVSLIIEGNGSLCGIGFLMLTESAGFAANAFSVSARNCATGNYTFSHEMGHNMGLQHDRIAQPANGVFPHSHGYVNVVNNFRDIMGVATGCGGCPRIQNFSNSNVTHNGFPTGVPIAAPNSADAAASLNATALTVANWRTQVTPGDFGGDGKSDIALYRSGMWFILRSTDNGITGVPFGGIAGDIPVPADYDGDGKTDIALYRNGTWFILRSTDNGLTQVLFGGIAGDIPVPADYDGDGKTDIALYRNGTWFILRSTDNGITGVQFGGVSDIPVPADYDGDGKADMALYRNGTWYILRSTGLTQVLFGGIAGDIPVPADYDGDGKSDIALYRNGAWIILRSTDNGITAVGFGGVAGDVPVPADYDGDGRTDIALYRNGAWYILRSSDNGITAVGFGGVAGDIPL